MTIKLLAEFIGWEKGCANTFMHADDVECRFCGWFDGVGTPAMPQRAKGFDPFTDANDALLVEARLREKNLWADYLEVLCGTAIPSGKFAVNRCMSATLEQRMKAAGKVIQEQAMTQSKRKAFKKEVRLLAWNKYGQRCAYCGCELEYKDMEIDHLWPIARSHQEPDLDPHRFENLMPSCRSCNYYKNSLTVDRFRQEIRKAPQRLMTGNAKFLFKLALRYGIIENKSFDGLFYFEKERMK